MTGFYLISMAGMLVFYLVVMVGEAKARAQLVAYQRAQAAASVPMPVKPLEPLVALAYAQRQLWVAERNLSLALERSRSVAC